MRRRVSWSLTRLVGAGAFGVAAVACSSSPGDHPSATITPRSSATARAVASAPAPDSPALLSPTAQVCPAGTHDLRCADVSSMAFAPVLHVVDGDTLHVEFEGHDESVRLYGIDAPEVGTPCADGATTRLRQLAGGAVRLRTDARDRDRYHRLLRYVYTTAGESIDAALVRDGLARAWRGDGRLEPAIVALENDARSSGRGCLWRPM